MKKVIHYDLSHLGKLHCDEPTCGYVLPSALPFTRRLIGFPCPKCESNMLTAADYGKVMRFHRIIRIINFVFGPIFGTREPPADGYQASVRFHGDEADIKVARKQLNTSHRPINNQAGD